MHLKAPKRTTISVSHPIATRQRSCVCNADIKGRLKGRKSSWKDSSPYRQMACLCSFFEQLNVTEITVKACAASQRVNQSGFDVFKVVAVTGASIHAGEF